VTLRVYHGQGVGAGPGATGKYEVRIIGPGCNASSNGDSGGNETKPKVDPPQDVPYDPNNQMSVKLYLFNSKKVRNADCFEGIEEVPMSITKRPSMLRASLEELIRYPEIQRGYSNFTTNISLQDVKIENGNALIYISGAIGDDCNRNRVILQLGRTARQFPSVKNVRIFLNNTEIAYR
jgi:spore germination protein GerM